MGQSAEEVRRDIERTRADMGYTLDAMGDRVSPRRMVERRTSRVTGAFRNARTTIMGSTTSAAHRVSDTTASAGSGVANMGGTVASGASAALDTVKEGPEMIRQQAQGNPMAAGLIAFGAGMLLGSLMPASSAEHQAATALAPKLEPLKDEAMHIGQELKERASDTASDVAASMKQHASDAGEHVKEQASETSGQMKQQAT